MKIAFTTYPNTNQNIGGVQMRVRRTFEALTQAGTNVELFDQWRHDLLDFQVLHSFKLHHSVYELVLTAHKRGVRNVISTVLPPEYPARLIRLMGKLWDRNHACNLIAYTLYHQAKIADALIAVSQVEADLITRAFAVSVDKVHVIPNSADASLYGAADPKLFGSQYGISGYVLTIGRLEPNKNQLRLIRAMRHIDCPLVVVGRVADDARDYAAKCYEAGKGRVLFIDQLPYNSPILASAYAGAEAFILPSVSEIAPNSTLEAAMAGTRVVVTRNSLAPAEWFGEGATYIDPLNEDAIAQQVRQALARPKDAVFRARVLEEFSWASGARKLIKVYRTVLDKEVTNEVHGIA